MGLSIGHCSPRDSYTLFTIILYSRCSSTHCIIKHILCNGNSFKVSSRATAQFDAFTYTHADTRIESRNVYNRYSVQYKVYI